MIARFMVGPRRAVEIHAPGVPTARQYEAAIRVLSLAREIALEDEADRTRAAIGADFGLEPDQEWKLARATEGGDR